MRGRACWKMSTRSRHHGTILISILILFCVCNNRPGPLEQKLIAHNAVNIRRNFADQLSWRAGYTHVYFAYGNQCGNILTRYESMCDRHLGLMRAVQHGIKLKERVIKPIHSAAYPTAPKAGEFEKQEIECMLCLEFVECARTYLSSLNLFVLNKARALQFFMEYGK